ncbi:MAG: Gfo/Idh/MocA family oxidoreductase [Flavobacteriales bacterium]|nr:Gfo/Idh/MocA family oxidoreductase [Flavobacteriales bacterium]
MVKVGIIGVGHLGKIHLKLLQEIDTVEVVGFYDIDQDKAKDLSDETGVKYFENADDLIDAVDAIDIVTPTLNHFEYANKAIRKSKHVFIEKPVTTTIEEAKKLINLSEEANVKVQVGHIERFNPAFLSVKDAFKDPMFIEVHRIAQFNPRGTDVSVVLDLMIHDIDIILSLVKSGIRRISASGVAVITESPDICNARIEFMNGCVANLTASRVSLKNMRKARFFQKDSYISVDFQNNDSEVVRLKNVEGEPEPFALVIEAGKEKTKKQILLDRPKVPKTNALKHELESFSQAILKDETPAVTISDAADAIDVAQKIIDQMSQINGLS